MSKNIKIELSDTIINWLKANSTDTTKSALIERALRKHYNIGNSPTGAQEFLIEMLSRGEVRANEVLDLAALTGISAASLKRAKSTLGIRSVKRGFNGRWKWTLPTTSNNIKDENEL